MSVGWATITSVLGLGAAVYSTIDMLLSQHVKDVLRDIYETNYLRALFFWDERKSLKIFHGRNTNDASNSLTKKVKLLEEELARIRADIEERRTNESEAIAKIRQEVNFQVTNATNTPFNQPKIEP